MERDRFALKWVCTTKGGAFLKYHNFQPFFQHRAVCNVIKTTLGCSLTFTIIRCGYIELDRHWDMPLVCAIVLIFSRPVEWGTFYRWNGTHCIGRLKSYWKPVSRSDRYIRPICTIIIFDSYVSITRYVVGHSRRTNSHFVCLIIAKLQVYLNLKTYISNICIFKCLL